MKNLRKNQKRKGAVPEGRAPIVETRRARCLWEIPYPDSPRQADAGHDDESRRDRRSQKDAHPWQRPESRGHAQNQRTHEHERDQDCRDHDHLHRNRQGDWFHLNLLSWLAPLSSREDHDNDGDALEHADEHGPEHGRTAHPNPLEDYRRLNRSEDDPHGEGDPLNARSGEGHQHLRRKRHRVHEDQASNHRFEELALQETPELSVQNINRAHRSLLSIWLGMCNQATVARLFCRYRSIIVNLRQGQQKIRTFAVSRFLSSWIKKFSSHKIKMWFEPMFFSGFFCGFERCGSAAFPNFRGGNSSPPAAAKCVRTNSRILHHIGNCKLERFASLRSATNLYSILGAKTNWRFRILGEEIFLILNF